MRPRRIAAIVIGSTAIAVTITYPLATNLAPRCHEDEVAVMYLPGDDYRPGMRATTCVPFDNLMEGWR